MTFVTMLDVNGLTAPQYRAVMDELGVDTRAEPGNFFGPRLAESAGLVGTLPGAPEPVPAS